MFVEHRYILKNDFLYNFSRLLEFRFGGLSDLVITNINLFFKRLKFDKKTRQKKIKKIKKGNEKCCISKYDSIETSRVKNNN